MRLDLRSLVIIVCAAGALVVSETLPGARAEDAPAVPKSRAEIAFSFAPVVKKAQPAVVNVFATRVERMPANPFFDDPIGPRRHQ